MKPVADLARRTSRALLVAIAAPVLLLLAACGGGTAPRPVAVSASVPPLVAAPVPTPAINYDTAEYRRTSAAVSSGAIAAWQAGASGQGVTIGFIDSGIDAASPEFQGRLLAASRDVSGRGRSVQDVSGHGTSVAAIAVAARNDSGIVGIAWNASIAMMRADNGDCTDGCRYADSAIAAGLDGAVAAGAKVINISLGGSSGSSALRNAFARAAASGAVIVVSAGNDAAAEVDPLPLAALAAGGPANVIVVGSSTQGGAIADFSNRAGSSRSNYLLALGESVRSFDHTGTAFLFSGTSFSAPAVAGAAALLAQAFPNLSAARIVEILLSTATDAGAPGTDAATGRGLLNIARAIAPIGPTSLVGTAVPVPLATSGSLGAPMGLGIAGAAGLARVPVHDRYQRLYNLALGSSLRPAAGGRLSRRLSAATLATAETRAGEGAFQASLELAASPFRARAAADSFRDGDTASAHIGLAQRGLDRNAAAQGPLQSMRMNLRAGPIGLTAATGAAERLPGAATSGFISEDGLAPDDGAAATDSRSLMADAAAGPLRLAFAASTRRIHAGQASRLDTRPDPRQDRLALAAELARGPVSLAVHASRATDRGMLLGSRLDTAWGLQGGTTTALGGALTLARDGFALRFAASKGRVAPDTSDTGLLRADGPLSTQSWSLAAEAPLAGGSLALRLAQPLAVHAGRFRLASGISLDAAVAAREASVELGYARGPLALGLFHRRNAGNIGSLADSGAAFTWRQGF